MHFLRLFEMPTYFDHNNLRICCWGCVTHSFLLLILLSAVAVAVLGVTVLVVSVLVRAVLGVAVGLLLGGLDLLGGLLSGGGTAESETDGFNKAASINFSW